MVSVTENASAGPEFVRGSTAVVLAVGSDAALECQVLRLGDKAVSDRIPITIVADLMYHRIRTRLYAVQNAGGFEVTAAADPIFVSIRTQMVF